MDVPLYLVLAHNDETYLKRFMKTFQQSVKPLTYQSLQNIHKQDNIYWSIVFSTNYTEHDIIHKERLQFPDIIYLIYPMNIINHNFPTMINDLKKYAQHCQEFLE